MDTYGFTTTYDDVYIHRVLDEADASTNFVITYDRDTLGNGDSIATVSVRNYVLALSLLYPELNLAGRPLFDWLVILADESPDAGEEIINEWSTATISGDVDDVAASVETVRHEVNRIGNILNGRIIRVGVESY